MTLDPLYLTTAIEAVVHAGDVMMSRFGTGVRIDKKGTIDLVTEVDVAIERSFRQMIAERFPDHAVLGEEMGGSAAPPAGPCWVFDPIDGTTNFAHGLPIFCASLALEVDGAAQVAAVYDPTRRELFTAERGERRVSERPAVFRFQTRRRSSTRCSSPVSHTTSTSASRRSSGSSRRSSAGRARSGGWDRRPSTSATSPPDGWTGSGKPTSRRGTSPAAR